MITYAQTGFLCSLHTPDAHTRQVLARMERQSQPIAFTGLHRLEFRNALRLRVFRKEILAEQRERSIQAMLSDLAAGVLIAVDPPWNDVMQEAERLSTSHSENLGTRSLDILHVACALVLGVQEFLTLDNRQKSLASVAGLQVPTL